MKNVINGIKQNRNKIKSKLNRRVKTPTVLQMEFAECGAASLGMILGSYERHVSLEELRQACGVSRDGSKASNIVAAARNYGLVVKAMRCEPTYLRSAQLPAIIHWKFNHFLVLEGFKGDKVYLNDPAFGSRIVLEDEFDHCFTGVALFFKPGPGFTKGGKRSNILNTLFSRLTGYKSALLYLILAGLALFFPGILIPAFSRFFIDSILAGEMTGYLFPLIIGMGFTAVLRSVLTWLKGYYMARLEMEISIKSALDFFWHILRLPISFFDQRRAGEVGSRIRFNDITAKLLAGRLSLILLDLASAVFFLIIMFSYDVALTMVGVVTAILNVAFLKYAGEKQAILAQRLVQDQGTLYSVTVGGINGIETIKAAGNESDFFATWTGYQAKMLRAEQSIGLSSQLMMAVPPLLVYLNTAVIIAVGGIGVMQSRLSLGMLIAFQSLMASFLGPVNSLVEFGNMIQNIKGYLVKLDDVLQHSLDEQLDEGDPQPSINEMPMAEKLCGYLELESITFGYSNLEPPLIENFSVRLNPGEHIALIGGSGSGKTTVSKLAVSLYKPWNGRILLDGKEREQIPRASLYGSIAMVDQNISFFEGTIWDNLSMWNPSITEEDILKACKDACVLNDILDRPKGLMDRIEESGRNFCGGQRQRLEIARALAVNPSILILDEATSALDANTEKMVMENIKKRGCTCLIVAHRLSTIRDCNEIIVLEKGKIIQRGNHDELKNIDGAYRDLLSCL